MIKSALTGIRFFDFWSRYKGLHNIVFICFYTKFEEHPFTVEQSKHINIYLEQISLLLRII